MTQERLILDPSEKAEGRTELDITPWIDVEGIDWSGGEINAYRAKAQVGESVIAYDFPNRMISVPLMIREQGGTSFATARSYIQAKAALGQREGLIGKRLTAQGGTVYFDIVANGLTLSGDWMQANRGVDTGAELRLEAIPDFYEPEELIAEAEEKTATELIKVIPDPGGDAPARVRIVDEEKQGEAIKSVIWHFRSRHYSSASTAKTAYEAEEMEPLGSSAKEALSGASNGTAVCNTALPSVFTPVLNTGYLTHTGTNRIFVRLRSPDGTAVSGQFSWDVGDLVNPTVNEAFSIPGGSAFFIADAGQVRLDPPPIGTHRWQGRFDFKGTEGGEDIQIDKVWIRNDDECSGILSAPPQPTVGTLTAWDNFNTHSAGTITGKVASLGGTWTGAGDAVGFTIDATNHWITRAEESDAGVNTGRYERLGTGKAAAVDASLDVFMAIPSGGELSRQGMFLRYTDVSNWLLVVYDRQLGGGTWITLFKRVAGAVTHVSNVGKGSFAEEWRTLRATVDTNGLITVYEGPQGSDPPSVLTASDAVLNSEGTLKEGGYGIYDAYAAAGSFIRKYDNFYVTVPTAASDAVIYASQKAQFTTQGMYRLDSGGSAYGPVSHVSGDLPRLPAGNLEGRSAEMFIKNSAGDMEELPDSSIPDLAAKVYVSRCWLTVPGTI